ncbi:DUF2089 domain-containing protein [Acidobacteria bacterium AB60]|nr:DUF2089 domain-containing protein [Acidobacteria bacterium AB60]
MSSERKSGTEWQELLRMAQGASLLVERVRIPEKGITVDGPFVLPQLARLTLEDQIFITAFLRAHGSIKEMEQVFGISYPTVKGRLNRIAAQLEFVENNPAPSRSEILERLNQGEITADEAIRLLQEIK